MKKLPFFTTHRGPKTARWPLAKHMRRGLASLALIGLPLFASMGCAAKIHYLQGHTPILNGVRRPKKRGVDP